MPITIYEKDIEKWAEWDIEVVTGEEDAFAIGRQVTLPSGRRLDLLAGCWLGGGTQLRLYVIEVKSQPATLVDLVQLARYVDEVRLFWGGAQVRGVLLTTDVPAEVWQIVDEMPDYSMALFCACSDFSGPSQWDFQRRENPTKPNPEFVSQFDEAVKSNTPPGTHLQALDSGEGEPA